MCWAITTSCRQSPTLQHLSVLRPKHAKCLPASASEQRGASEKAEGTRGDKPSHEADSLRARSAGRHIRRSVEVAGNGVWATARPSDITMRSTQHTVASFRLCGKRQRSPTCVHFIPALPVTMSFLTCSASCCEPTLFNRLLSGPVLCQRVPLHYKLVHGGPMWAQLGDEGSHSCTDWEQTVTLVLAPDRGAYCALFQQLKAFYSK